MMKKITYFFVFIAIPFIGISQNLVPNGSFENWDVHVFESPQTAPAFSENEDFENFVRRGVRTSFKVAGAGGSNHALRLESKLSSDGMDTVSGFFVWGTVNNFPPTKGIHLSSGDTVIGLSADLRYSIDTAMTGLIGIYPTKNGMPAGQGNFSGLPGFYIFEITGNQLSFTNQLFTLNPPLFTDADSCVIVLTVGNAIMEIANPGDWLEIDNVVLNGISDVVPGGDFETWVYTDTLEVVSDWNTNNHSVNTNFVSRTTDAFVDDYAVLLTNSYTHYGDSMPAEIMLGSMMCDTNSCDFIPGMALSTSTPKSFGFYYKYIVPTPLVDTANVYVHFTYNSNADVNAFSNILPASNWTFKQVNLPVSANIPDSAFIRFMSGSWNQTVVGAQLFIDDLKFHACDEIDSISGINFLCYGDSPDAYEFTVKNEFANAFTWSSSIGTISAGQNTHTITLDGIVNSGDVQVIKSYADGCPNDTLTLSIVVNPAMDTVITVSEHTLTVAETNASYQWVDCNNNYSHIAGANNQSFTATANGSYAVILTKNLCTDTSNCVAIQTIGMQELFAKNVKVFPNPTSGNITVSNENISENLRIRIINSVGQLVYSAEVLNKSLIDLTIEGPNGIYFLEISTATDATLIKVVKF
jgi:hypothetical protein